MKFAKSAFIVMSLMAVDAFAQPTPSPAPPGPNPQRPQLTSPPMSRPGLPPGVGPGAPKPPPVMPDKDKLSYAIGFNIGSSIKKDELDVDVDAIASAMKDVLQGKPTRFDDKEVKEIMTQFQGALRAKMAAQHEKQMAEAKAKAEEYLATNAKDTAVKSLPNGLQYKVLKDGSGDMPKATENVTVAYKGRLIDGTVFDSNDHFQTPVNGHIIKAWSEILPMMKLGSKWEVTVPPDLGYGPRPQAKIPANSVLIFEMELLSIAPPSTNAPAAATAHPGVTPVTHTASLSGQPPAQGSTSTPVVSGQIIKVPSADEIKKGAKIEVITNPPPPPPPPPPGQ